MSERASLVSRHALWLTGSFAALSLALIVMFSALVAWPMARRASDDLAGLMVLSAQTWAELPPDTRAAFEQELLSRHRLALRPPAGAEAPDEWHPPMIGMLERALNRRLNRPAHLQRELGTDGDVWYWMDLPVGTQGLAVGLPRDRYDSQPLVLLAAGLLASLAVAWAAARWLASRMAAPVQRLEQAMGQVGQGSLPQPVAEDGPQELARLSRHFNLMVEQVRDLLSARTTLLAGISHDLRTPLARMRLALEILRETRDTEMIDRLEAEIEHTNRLIGQVLDLARGLEQEPVQTVDLQELLQPLADQFGTLDTPVRLQLAVTRAQVPVLALTRALGNLLQNSTRYAPGHPVDLQVRADGPCLRLDVCDRGPGIPVDQLPRMLQPFQRMEPSRNAETGGSGLGLAIVRELARAHRWQLQIAPRANGGLRASLTLPGALQA